MAFAEALDLGVVTVAEVIEWVDGHPSPDRVLCEVSPMGQSPPSEVSFALRQLGGTVRPPAALGLVIGHVLRRYDEGHLPLGELARWLHDDLVREGARWGEHLDEARRRLDALMLAEDRIAESQETVEGMLAFLRQTRDELTRARYEGGLEVIVEALADHVHHVETYGPSSRMSIWHERCQARASLPFGYVIGPPEPWPISSRAALERIVIEFFEPLAEILEALESTEGIEAVAGFIEELRGEVGGVLGAFVEHEDEIIERFGCLAPPPRGPFDDSVLARFERWGTEHRGARAFAFDALEHDLEPAGLSTLSTVPQWTVFAPERVLVTMANCRVLRTLEELGAALGSEEPLAGRVVELLDWHVRDFFFSIGVNYMRFSADLDERLFGRFRERYLEWESEVEHQTCPYWIPWHEMLVEFVPLVDRFDEHVRAHEHFEEHPDDVALLEAYTPRFWCHAPLLAEILDVPYAPWTADYVKRFCGTPLDVHRDAVRFLGLEVLEERVDWVTGIQGISWFAPKVVAGHVVDFGAGVGDFFAAYRSRHRYGGGKGRGAAIASKFVGVDASPAMVDVARKRGFAIDVVDLGDTEALSRWADEHDLELIRACCVDVLQDVDEDARNRFITWWAERSPPEARLFISFRGPRDGCQGVLETLMGLGAGTDVEVQPERVLLRITKPPSTT